MNREKLALWDRRLLGLASQVAEWSSDPKTRVGAVIVGPENDVRALGYNGLPRKIENSAEFFERPLKYLWIEHAERNAIYAAARAGTSLSGCRMYVSWFPCADCARAIIQVGITEVVCVEPVWNNPTWAEQFATATKILEMGSVEVRFVGTQLTTEVGDLR